MISQSVQLTGEVALNNKCALCLSSGEALTHYRADLYMQ